MTIDRRKIVGGGALLGAIAVVGGCQSGRSEQEYVPNPDPVAVTGDTDVGFLLNVLEFGVRTGESDQSENFQRAIDAAHGSNRTLFVPGGRYTADGLILRNGSRILGAGAETSVIHAVSDSENEAVLQIDVGVAQHVRVESLGLEGADNEGQHGFLVRAQRGSDGVSGLWHSSFANMRIYNFDGAQLWLAGGGTDALDPIQFLDFVNMVLERKPTNADSISLLMSGQVNQTTWTGGRIDAFGAQSEGHEGVNLKICPQLEGYVPGFDSTSYQSAKVGHTHLFAGTTFQQSELAVLVERGESISFDTCHFEGLQNALLFRGTQGVRVDRSHFANATAANPERGYCIRAEENAQVTGHANMFIGDFGDMAASDASGASVQLSGSQGVQVAVTSGLTRELEASEEINAGASSTIVLSGNGEIRTIISSHFPGTDIRIRLTQGDVIFTEGGNLHVGPSGSLRLRSGGTVTFTRFDSGPEWVVSSVVGAI